MALSRGERIALAVNDAWTLAEDFTNRTQLIDHIIELGHGFRRQDMFRIVGNIWERKYAPALDPDEYRFNLVPQEYMAELVWSRKERFGIMGDAIYRTETGELELHRTVFWTDSYAEGLEYEQEWGRQVAEQNRYPNLEYVGFEIGQVWHKKGEDYGHPFVTEI